MQESDETKQFPIKQFILKNIQSKAAAGIVGMVDSETARLFICH